MSVELDLAEKWGATTFSNYEVFMIGESLIAWLGTTMQLGHESPGSTLDYATAPGSIGALIIRDVIAWTSGRLDLVPGAEDRLREMFADADIGKHLATRIALTP